MDVYGWDSLRSPVDLKDLCGFLLNPNDLLCFQQTSSTSNRKLHKSFAFKGLPLNLLTVLDLYMFRMHLKRHFITLTCDKERDN